MQSWYNLNQDMGLLTPLSLPADFGIPLQAIKADIHRTDVLISLAPLIDQLQSCPQIAMYDASGSMKSGMPANAADALCPFAPGTG